MDACGSLEALANVRLPTIAEAGWLVHSTAVMKMALQILGALCVLAGLLWVGQGAGVIHWPASSFMIDQRPWITRGAILAVVGVVLIVWSLRR